MITLLGLDLSTRAAAAVAVPTDWCGDWSRARWTVVGEKLHKGASEAERIERCRRVADHLARFACEVGAASAFIEGPAYSRAMAAHTLGELSGVVKLALLAQAMRIEVVSMSAARKLLCGRIPRGQKPKPIVQATLQVAGALPEIYGNNDVADAFCILNYAMAGAGGFAFAQSEAA